MSGKRVDIVKFEVPGTETIQTIGYQVQVPVTETILTMNYKLSP